MLQKTNPEIVRKQEQIDNCRVLATEGYELTKKMEAEGLVYFDAFETTRGCNTYCCYRGWAATLPHFKVLGMWPVQSRSPTKPMDYFDFDKKIFAFRPGEGEWTKIFGGDYHDTLENRRGYLLNEHIPRLEAELAELISEG